MLMNTFKSKTKHLYQALLVRFHVCLSQANNAKIPKTLGCFVGPQSEAGLAQALVGV